MLKQQLSLGQKQKLSPIQFQTIRMLGYSTAEIEDILNKELEANPALEDFSDESNKDSNELGTAQEDIFTQDFDNNNSILSDDLDIMEVYSSDTPLNYSQKNSWEKTDNFDHISTISYEDSFIDSLFVQIDEANSDSSIKQLAKYIIASLDESGYITRDLVNLKDDLAFSMGIEATEEDLQEALTLVQSIDPAGIGSRNLQECLIKQINRKKPNESLQIAKNIIENYFDKFTSKKYNFIKYKLNITDNQLNGAIKEIVKLNPKPAGQIENQKSDELTSQITPDFVVEQYNDNLYVSLNKSNYPHLSVSKTYKKMIDDFSAHNVKDHQTRQALDFAKKRVEEANVFIEAIKQRNLTLIRTMIAIANKQKDFFLTGDDTRIIPMRLKDIAEIVKYDTSTISRVTSSKYVQTQFGVFSLKYFFSESIKTSSGEDVSSKKIKSIIREMIDGEDKNDPLTDLEINQELKQQGYQISRRTIAKYREQLHIPATNIRTTKNNIQL